MSSIAIVDLSSQQGSPFVSWLNFPYFRRRNMVEARKSETGLPLMPQATARSVELASKTDHVFSLLFSRNQALLPASREQDRRSWLRPRHRPKANEAVVTQHL